MELAYEIADFLVLGCCFAAITLCVVVYGSVKERKWLTAAIYFVFIILIEELLYISEKGSPISLWLDEVFYSFAIGKSILYIVCAYLLTSLFMQTFRIKSITAAILPPSLLALWMLMFSVIKWQSNLTSFLYVLPYQILTLFLSMWGLKILSGTGRSGERKKRLKYLLTATAVFSLLIVAEDFICLSPLTEAFVHGEVKERNFCENVMQITLALFAVHAASVTISKAFLRRAEGFSVPRQEAEYDMGELDLNKTLAALSLTPRECELFPYLLEPMSYQKIGEELFISAGTVKAHTHNILQKLGVSSRRDLIRWVNGLQT